jgi:hypothetical protein
VDAHLEPSRQQDGAVVAQAVAAQVDVREGVVEEQQVGQSARAVAASHLAPAQLESLELRAAVVAPCRTATAG